ncbi:MAG: hypothetical protein HY830_13360 [Actinobacteria bacterium]|nr:hypothetical protein [Actinomycetota bacterium]
MATQVLDAVERAGVLLVHDAALPCVTALVTGGPVAGSWWSHPMANAIYNALGELEDDVATVRLLRAKQTLVARRLWPAVAAVGAARVPWQLRRLPAAAADLLAEVDAVDAYVVPAAARSAADALERRLLVTSTEVHTPSGHHVKAYRSWRRWAADRAVGAADDVAAARDALEQAARATSTDVGPLLPWPV